MGLAQSAQVNKDGSPLTLKQKFINLLTRNSLGNFVYVLYAALIVGVDLSLWPKASALFKLGPANPYSPVYSLEANGPLELGAFGDDYYGIQSDSYSEFACLCARRKPRDTHTNPPLENFL